MRQAITGILIMAFLSWVAATYYFWRFNVQRITLLKELDLINADKKKPTSLPKLFRSYLFRWSEKVASVGMRFTMFVNKEDLERRIALAGSPDGLTVPVFFGMRFLLVLTALILGDLLLLVGFGTLTQLILLLLGLFGPNLWVSWRASKRQEQLGLDLPEFLDSMSVALQAGTPMDPAIKQIIDTLEGPLSEELLRFLQEIDLGVPREEAYVRLMERNSCPELETLVLSLIQGSKLGVPIANTFKVMADDMREARIGKIKEKATKAGPKITLVTTFIIMPGVLLCIVGLMVLNFIYNPEGMGISGGLNF